MFVAYSTGSRIGIKAESFTRPRTFVTLKRKLQVFIIVMYARQKNSIVNILIIYRKFYSVTYSRLSIWNRLFYSCRLSDLTSEWQRGWSCPCFDTDGTREKRSAHACLLCSGAYLPLKLYAITKQTRFRPRNSKK